LALALAELALALVSTCAELALVDVRAEARRRDYSRI
jgi:hypothetical protein